MKRLELAVESIILASRWLLVAFYLGLGLALAVYAVSFGKKLVEFITQVMVLDDTDTILKMLGLIDAALVASLVVMVIISGYENFVSRIDTAGNEHGLDWLGKLDSGTLKLKVAASIVAISSIHLLRIFMNAQQIENDKIFWYVVLHLTFVVSAVLMGVLDRIVFSAHRAPDDKAH